MWALFIIGADDILFVALIPIRKKKTKKKFGYY
jgi:hypothetical protein